MVIIIISIQFPFDFISILRTKKKSSYMELDNIQGTGKRSMTKEGCQGIICRSRASVSVVKSSKSTNLDHRQIDFIISQITRKGELLKPEVFLMNNSH